MESLFTAVYYPFSRCFNPISLKRAILYYDRIYFLDPYNLDQRESLIETSHYYYGIDFGHRHEWAQMIESVYRPLEGEGWIEGVNIFPLIEKYDHQLTENTLEDITDPTFCSYSFGDIAVNVEKVSWHVLRERTPPSLLSNLQEVPWNDFRDAVASNAAIYAPFNDPYLAKYLSFYKEYYRNIESPLSNKEFAMVYTPTDKCPNESGFHRHGLMMSEESDDVTGFVVPYAIGSSISINQALLFAAIHQSSLFTDSLTQHYLLKRKFQNAIEKTQQTEKRKQNIKVIQSIKETDIVFNLLDDLIPDSYFSEIPIDEIIRFRKKHEKELKFLRSYMLEIRHSSTNPWEEGYLESVQKICDKAKRETQKLRKEFKQTTKDMKRNTIKAATGVLLGLAAMPVSISAGAVLAILASKVPLDEVWKAWKQRSDLKEHDLMYLLLMEDTFSYGFKGGEQLPWERTSIIRVDE